MLNEVNMDNLLEKLKIYMKAKGLTIYKLTEMSDLSENTIYNWYNKGSEPTLKALYSICKILEISMAELFTENDNEILSLKEKSIISNYRELSESRKELVVKLLSELNE